MIPKTFLSYAPLSYTRWNFFLARTRDRARLKGRRQPLAKKGPLLMNSASGRSPASAAKAASISGSSTPALSTNLLKHPTLDQLHALGLHGMAKAFAEIAAGGQSQNPQHSRPARRWNFELQDEMRVGQKNELYLPLDQERLASSGHPRSTHPINLSVRRGMPRARSRRCSRAPRLQHRGHATPSRRNRNQSYPGAHAILILDQAGWHGAKDLKAPKNITLLSLPPRAPELNPQENIWQFMRANWLSNRIFKSFDDIVDHCCYAWNTLIDQPWKYMSIARRDWAVAGHLL